MMKSRARAEARRTSHFAFAIISLAMLVCGAAARGAADADGPRSEIDPTTAEVASPPVAMVDPLSDAEYATAYAEARKNLGPVAAAVEWEQIAGARITSVEADSPAQNAGLRVNDTIVAIDGK